jgi:hypothetical protein
MENERAHGEPRNVQPQATIPSKHNRNASPMTPSPHLRNQCLKK